MRKINPYKVFDRVLKALYRGGRFYNILAEAKDETITRAQRTGNASPMRVIR